MKTILEMIREKLQVNECGGCSSSCGGRSSHGDGCGCSNHNHSGCGCTSNDKNKKNRRHC